MIFKIIIIKQVLNETINKFSLSGFQSADADSITFP